MEGFVNHYDNGLKKLKQRGCDESVLTNISESKEWVRIAKLFGFDDFETLEMKKLVRSRESILAKNIINSKQSTISQPCKLNSTSFFQ
jgi:hypothetical protein